MNFSQAEENYLKELLSLSLEQGHAPINLLSKRLNIKMPTANSMTKKMAEKELVNYESYKPISLTHKGKREAALILRRHRLTEMFLVEKMGFGWEEVHPIAEQIEHIKSLRFFEKMDEILNYPAFDPHGSPIPDKDGNIIDTNSKLLTKAEVGNTVTFTAVRDSNEDFLKFLNKKNLNLGAKIKILAKESFDSSMSVEIDGSHLEELSAVACERMLVVADK